MLSYIIYFSIVYLTKIYYIANSKSADVANTNLIVEEKNRRDKIEQIFYEEKYNEYNNQEIQQSRLVMSENKRIDQIQKMLFLQKTAACIERVSLENREKLNQYEEMFFVDGHITKNLGPKE